MHCFGQVVSSTYPVSPQSPHPASLHRGQAIATLDSSVGTS